MVFLSSRMTHLNNDKDVAAAIVPDCGAYYDYDEEVEDADFIK